MRYLTPEIDRFFLEEAKMAFIAGPRQVGKTTLAKHLLAQIHAEAFYFNWDIESHRKAIIKSPEDFWQGSAPIPGRPKPRLGLDEIHKYPRWKRFLKGLYDAKGKDLEILVIREDLRDLTRIREIGLVESLVTLLPERIGSPLSVNALREDLGVNFMTVQAWLEALERLYFLFRIRPYAGRLARTLRREEKVYLFDPSAIENEGAKFENLVALHLRKLCDAWTDWGYGDFNLFYVRDREKREVDFLITDRHKVYALIECKLRADGIDSSLRYFSERLKPKYAVQVMREPEKGKSISVFDEILAVPATVFLSLI